MHLRGRDDRSCSWSCLRFTGLRGGRSGGWCLLILRPGDDRRLHNAPKDGQVYRFEIGGDGSALRFICSFIPVKSYVRKSAVFLPDKGVLIPYPIQNRLRYLGAELAAQALHEMVKASKANQLINTMADWLKGCFGPTLCDLFFLPFPRALHSRPLQISRRGLEHPRPTDGRSM